MVRKVKIQSWMLRNECKYQYMNWNQYHIIAVAMELMYSALSKIQYDGKYPSSYRWRNWDIQQARGGQNVRTGSVIPSRRNC